MNDIIVNVQTKEVKEIPISEQEMAFREEQNLTRKFEESLKPLADEVEQAEFERKTITLLAKLGVI